MNDKDINIEEANLKLLKTALQEKVFFNPLKRFLYKEELRLQKLLANILEVMPQSLLNMKIGDLIDVCRGIHVVSNSSLASFSEENRIETTIELLCWIRKFLPTPEEQSIASVAEERGVKGEEGTSYEDTCELIPPPKRAKLDNPTLSCDSPIAEGEAGCNGDISHAPHKTVSPLLSFDEM